MSLLFQEVFNRGAMRTSDPKLLKYTDPLGWKFYSHSNVETLSQALGAPFKRFSDIMRKIYHTMKGSSSLSAMNDRVKVLYKRQLELNVAKVQGYRKFLTTPPKMWSWSGQFKEFKRRPQ